MEWYPDPLAFLPLTDLQLFSAQSAVGSSETLDAYNAHLIDENVPGCLRYVQLVRAVIVPSGPRWPKPLIRVQIS